MSGRMRERGRTINRKLKLLVMCLAIPGKILKINDQLATVDFSGIQKEVNISLLSDAKKGEFVIVHAGFAIEKIEEDVVTDIQGYLK